MVMNRYPLWKNGLILFILALGILYAMPNLFGEDPAVQISMKGGGEISTEDIAKITGALHSAGYATKGITQEDSGHALVRLKQQSEQLEVKELIARLMGNDYIAALNLAPAAPAWLRALGADPLKLGLDLRGGVHFLMQVDVEATVRQREKGYLTELRNELRKERIRYSGMRQTRPNGLVLRFKDQNMRQRAVKLLRQRYQEFTLLPVEPGHELALRMTFTEAEITKIRDYAIEQSITTLRNRVNELGVAEAVVQRQGANRIVVQLPGVQDTARAKEIIGKTATLEFLMVNDEVDSSAAMAGSVPPGSRVIVDAETNRPYVFKNQVILSGENIVGAQSDYDEYGKPAVSIRVGGSTSYFSKVTRENKGKLMGTIYKETRFEDKLVNGETVRTKRTIEKAISVATIRSALGNRFQISNVGSPDDARNLALLLRAGALPAPVDIVEERTIGPSLGLENIRMGMNSILGGLTLVLVFMTLYYRVFGLIANLALLANLMLLLAVLSAISATLTLPGIAGVVLTLGMAVDANVLIFERIREEIRNKASPQTAINSGFEKALSTIMDANITTFIAALVLFTIGSGPIKGFAVTLTIGLVTSVFTAIMVTRALVNWYYGGRKVTRLSIGI